MNVNSGRNFGANAPIMSEVALTARKHEKGPAV
jgi:hypothetical protein